MLTERGQGVIALSDLVDSFCLEQGNMREANITKVLVHAKWVWKDIFRTVIAQNKTQVFRQKHHTFKLPNDCQRVYNISVVDHCGVLHPLTLNSDANTAQIRCVECSCKVCKGEGTLCNAIDSLQATQTPQVFTAPAPYTTTVTLSVTSWVITNSCGDIQKVTKYPVPLWNAGVFVKVQDYEVVTETICKVEVDNHGCIIPTEANLELMGNTLGMWGFNQSGWNGFLYVGTDHWHRELLEPPFNYYGFWNYNAADPQIIHVFRNSRCPKCNQLNCCNKEHSENNIGSIIVSYLTNGEEIGKEILVPEYAYDAMVLGIMYRMKALSIKPSNIMEAKYLYLDAKKRAMEFLNPIRLDDVYKIQSTKILW